MAPPSATDSHAAQHANGHKKAITSDNHDSSLSMDGKVVGPPQFEDKYEEREYLKARLALAFRIFHQHGFDRGVAGHITIRDPVEPTSFWVNPFGLAWKRMRASDLILISADGEIVDGGKVRILNAAAYAIHHAVHTARPDVNCVAHSHSTYGQAYCALGRELDMATIDACAFYNDHVLYNAYNGVVLAGEEGDSIAKALGPRKAAFLQNHGMLTCGKSIESAVHWFVYLDQVCHTQLLADAAAGGRGSQTVKVTDEEAASTYKVNGTEAFGYFSAGPLFQMMEEDSGDHYKS